VPVDQPPPAPPAITAAPAPGSPHYHGQLALVSGTGEVSINWANVDATAADEQSEKEARGYALLLLAARYHTDKPLPDPETK